MKTILTYILLVFFFSLSSCSKYLVKDRFVESELSLATRNGSINLDANYFFILKTVKSKSNKIINNEKEENTINQEEYADVTSNIFDQVVKGYPRYWFPGDSVIAEENYLYLDKIDAIGLSKGRAIYFNTYHLLYERYQKPYLNNPKFIFSGIMKELKIGYWFKVGDEISIYFESASGSERLIGFKGKIQKNEENDRTTFLMSKSSTVATTKKNKFGITRDSPAEKVVPLLDASLLYVRIENVFNLKQEKGLHFKQVRPGREFLLQKFNGKKQETISVNNDTPFIDEIIWGESQSPNDGRCDAVFFKISNGDYYKFKKNKRSKDKKDQRFFSILTLY